MVAVLLCKRSFHRRGSLFSRLVVAPLLCKATMLDEREVRGRVVGLLAATVVGQRVPEALYISLIATALVGQRLPNVMFDRGIVQRCRKCCGSR